MIRYADDAVLGFQKHQDARACQSLLQRRLMQFGLKSLRQRSQRHKMTWARYSQRVNKWIPPPRIVHPYPLQHFYAKHPR
ncbi:hypothetical protein Ppb6_02596 [Photorhabdus australis subsp. thailandensis]|uniref:Reverse transcriptase domain-containing protein n=1 Tax=Photorhabdus australis subsp. thailandensis TaxID=2805096 RepID=A0A1C0U2N3_9GAMM|nr:hypothetical protein Ppb6_02596 [Photorhabdus australis subsp. thailandensis]